MTDSTPHLELYKKYRPVKWSGLVGQNKVAESLKTAVKTNRLPVAYLFAGPRGTGKTSAALLLAKTVNCEHLKEDGNPCNRCDVCRNIDRGAQLGVSYLSMANHQGVENVRNLVQQARLNQPVNKQVWILDEVHNLSKQAFDALLIPLEEKNMPSLFIFCTTEIDRVPQTILSRVQQRRFNLVEADTMLMFLTKISSHEKLDVTEDDLKAAVRMGRGSVRDSLTALESIVATGEAAHSFGGQLLEAISRLDPTETIKVIAEANGESVDFRELSEQLFEDLRDLLLLSSGVDKELVGIPPVLDTDSIIEGMQGPRGVMLLMNGVGSAITQMSMGADSRILLEVSLMKGLDSLKRLAQAR